MLKIWDTNVKVQDIRLPVVLIIVDGESGDILDVRVEQPQFVTALVTMQKPENITIQGENITYHGENGTFHTIGEVDE